MGGLSEMDGDIISLRVFNRFDAPTFVNFQSDGGVIDSISGPKFFFKNFLVNP